MTNTATNHQRITRDNAETLGLGAYAGFADALETVTADQWSLPTDCEGWTVRDLAGHMVGAMRSAASMREMMRQQKEIKRRVKHEGGDLTDTMTAVQVDWTADLSHSELVAECRSLVEPAARGRAKTPALMRKLIRFEVSFGQTTESWTLGYLVDTILTRDAWLHTVDLTRAVGAEMVLTADLDGLIVGDVAREWVQRHGQPIHLELTGPAGGSYTFGSPSPGQTLSMDGVEFCRALSGRAPQSGLLETDVPF